MRRFLIVCLFVFFALPAFSTTYKMIDSHARKAPVLEDNDKLDELVQYLIKPYQMDKERARVLLAWIVYHIDYDDYVFKKIQEYKEAINKRHMPKRIDDIPENDILEIRAGVCGDIANLYKKMGAMAGLSVEVVSGSSFGCDFDEFKQGFCAHAWNVVKINGEWEYVDPTWAMIGQQVGFGANYSLRQYERDLNKRMNSKKNLKARKGRDINEVWFLTDKELMIKTHFPVNEQWQLQKEKITEAEFLGLDKQAYKTAEKRKNRRDKRRQESESYKERQRQSAAKE